MSVTNAFDVAQDPAKMKKVSAALLIGLVVCNIFAFLMNFSVSSALGSNCSVYVARATSNVIESSDEYNEKYLKAFVADNSVPQWVNPSWRIPTVSIVDADQSTTYVQGDTITAQHDDQYNTLGKSTATDGMVSKLEAVPVDNLKYPVTLSWVMIEGADVHHILNCQLVLGVAVCAWATLLLFLSQKGHAMLQFYMMWAVFATVWFAGSVNTAEGAMEHPPTSAELSHVPEAQLNNLLVPCNPSSSAPGQMQVMCMSMLVQVVFLISLIPVNRIVAKATNREKGTKDPLAKMFLQNE